MFGKSEISHRRKKMARDKERNLSRQSKTNGFAPTDYPTAKKVPDEIEQTQEFPIAKGFKMVSGSTSHLTGYQCKECHVVENCDQKTLVCPRDPYYQKLIRKIPKEKLPAFTP